MPSAQFTFESAVALLDAVLDQLCTPVGMGSCLVGVAKESPAAGSRRREGERLGCDLCGWGGRLAGGHR